MPLVPQNDAIQWLHNNGWRETNEPYDECRVWLKPFPAEPKCKTNQPKPINIVLKFWEIHDRSSFELIIRGEPVDGVWVCFEVYGFNDIFLIPDQCEKLLRAWRAVN